MKPASSEEIVERNYFPAIQGLRGLAVILVILFHTNVDWFPNGYVGVDIFFVISGFLITRNLLNNSSLCAFYSQRIRRIIPSLVFTILGMLALVVIFASPKFTLEFVKEAIWGLTNSANLMLMETRGYFDELGETRPLLNLWSLSLEEQFYLVFPILLILTRKHLGNFVGLAAWGLMLCSSLVLFFSANESTQFFNPLMRIWEILAGSVTALYLSSEFTRSHSNWLSSRKAGVFALITGALLVFIAFSAFAINVKVLTFLAVIITLFLLANITTKVRSFWMLSINPLRHIGDISFPLYLWHLPLLLLLKRYLPIFSEWFLFLTLLYGLSIVTSKFIERPMRSRLAKITPVIFGVLGTLSLLFLLQSADGLREKYPKPMLGLVQPVASTWLDDVRIGTCLLQDKVAKFHKAECSASQEDEIMVWGDSHAASLVSWAMMESNAKNKSRISQLTQAGCPPLLELRTLIYRENCNQINQRILERIRSTHPETIVLAAAWKHPDYPLTLTDLAKKLDYTLDLIGKNSPKSKVIVVGPAPWWLDSAQEDSISRSGNILSGYTPADRYIVATQFTDVEHLLSRVSANNRVSYFSTIDSLCLGTKCLARDPAGHFTSADRSHLSRFGSKIVWQGIVSKFHFY